MNRQSWLGSKTVRSAFLVATLCLTISSRGLSIQIDSTPSQSSAQTSVAPAPGVDPSLDERVRSVASHLRCPVCQGESIQDSPAELATQMKTLVREQLAAGKTESEVREYFVQKYGQWILLAPRAEGFNLLVYWLPVLFLVLGGAGIWVAVKRWTAVAPSAPESDGGADSAV